MSVAYRDKRIGIFEGKSVSVFLIGIVNGRKPTAVRFGFALRPNLHGIAGIGAVGIDEIHPFIVAYGGMG